MQEEWGQGPCPSQQERDAVCWGSLSGGDQERQTSKAFVNGHLESVLVTLSAGQVAGGLGHMYSRLNEECPLKGCCWVREAAEGLVSQDLC